MKKEINNNINNLKEILSKKEYNIFQKKDFFRERTKRQCIGELNIIKNGIDSNQIRNSITMYYSYLIRFLNNFSKLYEKRTKDDDYRYYLIDRKLVYNHKNLFYEDNTLKQNLVKYMEII